MRCLIMIYTCSQTNYFVSGALNVKPEFITDRLRRCFRRLLFSFCVKRQAGNDQKLSHPAVKTKRERITHTKFDVSTRETHIINQMIHLAVLIQTPATCSFTHFPFLFN